MRRKKLEDVSTYKVELEEFDVLKEKVEKLRAIMGKGGLLTSVGTADPWSSASIRAEEFAAELEKLSKSLVPDFPFPPTGELYQDWYFFGNDNHGKVS